LLVNFDVPSSLVFEERFSGKRKKRLACLLACLLFPLLSFISLTPDNNQTKLGIVRKDFGRRMIIISMIWTEGTYFDDLYLAGKSMFSSRDGRGRCFLGIHDLPLLQAVFPSFGSITPLGERRSGISIETIVESLRVYRSSLKILPGDFHLPMNLTNPPTKATNPSALHRPATKGPGGAEPSPKSAPIITVVGLSPILTYNKDRVLGTGANGTTVYEGTYQEGNGNLIYTQTCAVKRMIRSRESYAHCKEVSLPSSPSHYLCLNLLNSFPRYNCWPKPAP